MSKLATINQHMAHMLSFSYPNSQLAKTISAANFDWDTIVIEGSKHLVLPALYCRLKAKQLLHILPKELVDYLEQITNINRSRNQSILNQVHNISKILNDNSIDHVFLKGTALLASGYFKDNGERMVGDIDILVAKPQLHKAFNLLKVSGYDKTSGFAYDKKDFRHLDRLIATDKLAAIELHSELLNKSYWSLMDMENVINSKTIVNGVAIPHINHFRKHIVLSWQLNDFGHYYNRISFKSHYDFIALDAYIDDDFITTLLKLKYGKSYLELVKYYFPEFSKVPSNYYMTYRKLFYKAMLYYKPLNYLVSFTKQFTKFTFNRLYLVITNTSYVKHIIKNKLFKKSKLF
ncbi:nucleotidyltransferase family protein [Winogradskyella vidalii]|uniref:nucleotidyltransferase family protein n=1 Tax=Winogradskyella vidalii TaxID=2615024 RepID=UPI0015C7D59B|nr:nucleotidyltransferase family protein [Winogradskyella vidalii]